MLIARGPLVTLGPAARSTFHFGVDGWHVTHTIGKGKALMRHRRILTLGGEATAAREGTRWP